METSLYEKNHPSKAEQAFGIAFGRITAVFPEDRMCEVKTFLGAGAFNDQHIPKCQWLNMDANPEGDESSSIPRVNSIGLVFWIDGEPFIFGFWKALNAKGQAITGKEPAKLNEGDKLISSIAGNKITVKSNGVIEIVSKDTLKTVYFPTNSLLVNLCANYEFRADGGKINWKTDETTGTNTLHSAEYRKDIARSTIIVEERGYVDATTIKRTLIGVGVPGQEGVPAPSFEMTTTITGETTLAIHAPGLPGGFKAVVSPTGDTEIDINKLGSVKLGSTGTIDVVAKLATFSMQPTGEITIKNPGVTITVSATGEIKMEAKQKITLDAKAGIDINSAAGAINVKSIAGAIKVSGKTIELDGMGTGATDYILCNPTTISPFTGSPLAPFSTTVKVSK